MKQGIVIATLAALSLLMAANLAFAAEGTPATKTSPKETTATIPPAAKKTAKKIPNAKLIDINSASKTELKKLPGITDAHAGKIISGRPYLSKAHLLTHKILPAPLYEAIKEQVAVKNPEKALKDLKKIERKK